MKTKLTEVKFTIELQSLGMHINKGIAEEKYKYLLTTNEKLNSNKLTILKEEEEPETVHEFLKSKNILEFELVEWLNKHYTHE